MNVPRTKIYSVYKNLVIQILQNEGSNKLNFKPDGREHYVYRVTDYTRDAEQHYIGSHTPYKRTEYSSIKEEFWTYKTSSKHNILDESNKENYKVKILKVFNNSADKMIYEAFLHQYYNVKEHIHFWNKSNQTPFGFDTTGISFTKKPMEQSTKNLLSTINKGKKLSDETRKKMSRSRLGRKLSKETRDKIGNKKTGSKSVTALYINIYNSKGFLEYSCNGTFHKLCEEKDLPLAQLKKSYQNGGTRIIMTNNSKSQIDKKYHLYVGWYAIKIKLSSITV